MYVKSETTQVTFKEPQKSEVTMWKFRMEMKWWKKQELYK